MMQGLHGKFAAYRAAAARKPAAEPGLPFAYRPSVGAWLAPPPPKLQRLEPEDPFEYKPSVGSWCAARPPQVERPWFLRETRAQGEAAVVISTLQRVLAEREREP